MVRKENCPRWLFLLGVSLLFTHELDAMTHAEWQVLPLTSWLEPNVGRVVFVVFHVPLFAVVLGWLTSHLPQRAAKARLWIAGFLVLHGGLHAAFTSHPAYTFDGLLSNMLIFGAALCGGLYLALRRWEQAP